MGVKLFKYFGVEKYLMYLPFPIPNKELSSLLPSDITYTGFWIYLPDRGHTIAFTSPANFEVIRTPVLDPFLNIIKSDECLKILQVEELKRCEVHYYGTKTPCILFATRHPYFESILANYTLWAYITKSPEILERATKSRAVWCVKPAGEKAHLLCLVPPVKGATTISNGQIINFLRNGELLIGTDMGYEFYASADDLYAQLICSIGVVPTGTILKAIRLVSEGSIHKAKGVLLSALSQATMKREE